MTNQYPLLRTNPSGLRYRLYPVGPNKTIVRFGETEILLNENIEKLNQAWYNWIIKDQMIQNAFSFLNADEREFLLTGISPDKWNELFNESDEFE